MVINFFHVCVFVGAVTVTLCSAQGFGGSEEKFIKKYAMMKVYESCFGPHVLKEIRREMKDAAQKCSGVYPHLDGNDKGHNKDGNNLKPTPMGDWHNQDAPYRAKPFVGLKVKKPIHTTDTLLLQQWNEEQKHNHADSLSADEHDQLETETSSGLELDNTTPPKKPIDFSKLEEAIMNIGRPAGPLAMQKPLPASGSYQQSTAVGYYPAVYYPPPVPIAAASYPYHAYYPGYFQPPPSPANLQSLYRSGLRAAKITNFNSRTGKHSDLKAQMESLTFQYNGKARNISCIMQELGYLDENLEPNYAKMADRINKLQINDELKRDMLDSVKFCRQFSQCIPETRQDSFHLSKELLKPMFFFRCYKHKKLESCIMKDIRDRLSMSSAEFTNEARTAFRSNDFVTSIFDSIYGISGDYLDSTVL